MFPAIIINAKETGEIQFHPLAPTFEYQHKDPNSYCFISLSSELTEYG